MLGLTNPDSVGRLAYGFLEYTNVSFLFCMLLFLVEVAVMRSVELRRAGTCRQRQLEVFDGQRKRSVAKVASVDGFS